MARRDDPGTAGRALVTGASGGLGRELARQFAAGGFDLVLVARREGRLHELAGELEADHGVDAAVVAMDLAERGAAERLYEAVNDRGHRVDALVNNAGLGAYGPFDETDLDRELDQLRVNVETPLHLTKLFLPAMVDRGAGTLLNVASVAAFTPGPGMAGYYASKAHLLSLTGSLAEELSGTGVSATALCPGPTETEFHERAGMEDSGVASFYTMDAERVARAGYRGAVRGDVMVVPGLANKALYYLSRFAPRVVNRKAAAWINAER